MLQWYGKRVEARIISNIEMKLKEAGEVVKEEAKKSMPVNFNAGEGDVGIFRSSAGDPPFRQTDKLYKSIFSELQPTHLAVKIGTPLKYGKYLEFGTSKMKWRPWLVPALAKSVAKIRMIFAKPIDSPNETIQLGAGTSRKIRN